ncbi:MAG: anthranilate phosphoribosyltransferase [Candidatus Magasanikbacteria bacterium CG10_big_fil_rev_8_21_14_0_10_40_10]|uniref:Anthranilate phosphoribosyltransferase n=1 Tax=Candidatus Magasanikbacteria bacterium CG10_big_fil_rev_8_21_14_0_10_40_10 TaxID=1974648 RepID=A0A2M6W457_9BACT|nr:MAG: anthranilate phosphoribosyltransferase [Candidatus Magasanikbacteria bacterium CG10_big_fil_rev_8_21_14_0_10_40_10]
MKQYLKKLISGQDLDENMMQEIFEGIIAGSVDPIMAGGILTALAAKGETENEIRGVVKTMRKHMKIIQANAGMAGVVLDTCGTGGDGARTINVSTLAALLCAAAGVKVAKHGNRSVSSKCGSFDVLEELGVKIDLEPKRSLACLNEIGIACLFAPMYHPAMKNIAPIRKALGIRTVFNLIGPALNPASANCQLIGVCDLPTAEKLGRICLSLGSKKVLLAHSRDGLDEISASAPTDIYEFNIGHKMKKYTVEPESQCSLDELKGDDSRANAKILSEILQGRGTDAQNEFVALNVAGGLVAAGVYDDFALAKKRAHELLESGAGFAKLQELVKYTNQ